MTIYVTQKEKDSGINSWLTVVSAKILLVDLAGSELVGKSYLAGKQLDEAKMINKSLSSLGLVIAALTTRVTSAVHIPYRNSKLTRILEESLGGTSRLSLIMTVSPAVANANETLSTLRFGLRAKVMQNKVIKHIHRISSSSSSNYGSSNNPYKGGGILIGRMSSGSSRDNSQNDINTSISRVTDKLIEITLRRAERRLDAQSNEIMQLNAQLESIETRKLLDGISKQGSYVDLARDSDLDFAVSLQDPKVDTQTRENYAPFSPDSSLTNGATYDDCELMNLTSQMTGGTSDGSEDVDADFADPYLETNLIYKCLDFDENGVHISTNTKSPSSLLNNGQSRIPSLCSPSGKRATLSPESRRLSFPGLDYSDMNDSERVGYRYSSPASHPLEGVYGSSGEAEGGEGESEDLLTKLAKQLADESIIVLAVTELLHTEREKVSRLTDQLALMRVSDGVAPSPLRIGTPCPLSPLSPCGSAVSDRSIYAEAEEGRLLSTFLSQQLKAQSTQLRIISEQLLKQKMYSSTVTEKLSRVQATSAGIAMTLSMERASVELLVTSLRNRIVELDKISDEKDKRYADSVRSRGLDNHQAATIEVKSIETAQLIDETKKVEDAVVGQTEQVVIIETPVATPAEPELLAVTAEHVTPCGFNDEIPVIYVEKPAFTKGGSLSDLALDIPMDRTRNPRGPDVPTLNLVATVVAAIEQKCTPRHTVNNSDSGISPRMPPSRQEEKLMSTSSLVAEVLVAERMTLNGVMSIQIPKVMSTPVSMIAMVAPTPAPAAVMAVNVSAVEAAVTGVLPVVVAASLVHKAMFVETISTPQAQATVVLPSTIIVPVDIEELHVPAARTATVTTANSVPSKFGASRSVQDAQSKSVSSVIRMGPKSLPVATTVATAAASASQVTSSTITRNEDRPVLAGKAVQRAVDNLASTTASCAMSDKEVAPTVPSPELIRILPVALVDLAAADGLPTSPPTLPLVPSIVVVKGEDVLTSVLTALKTQTVPIAHAVHVHSTYDGITTSTSGEIGEPVTAGSLNSEQKGGPISKAAVEVIVEERKTIVPSQAVEVKVTFEERHVASGTAAHNLSTDHPVVTRAASFEVKVSFDGERSIPVITATSDGMAAGIEMYAPDGLGSLSNDKTSSNSADLEGVQSPMYYSGQTDNSVDLGDSSSVVDDIPQPQEEDTLGGKVIRRGRLSALKSTGSGRFQAESL